MSLDDATSAGGAEAQTGSSRRTERRGQLGARAYSLLTRFRDDLVGAALVAFVPFAAALAVLRVWRGSLSDPWDYNGDALFVAMIVKGVLDFGWHMSNPRLGAPFGQELHDIPVVPLETFSIGVIRFIGLFTSDTATALNVFYLLGFPLAGLAAYLALRALRVSVGASAVCAILFALLPYHFVRAEPHIFLATYVTVPASCYLVLQVLRGTPLLTRRADGRGRGPLVWASGRTLVTLALCVLVGSSGGYYIPFTLVLLGIATLVAFAAHRPKGRAPDRRGDGSRGHPRPRSRVLAVARVRIRERSQPGDRAGGDDDGRARVANRRPPPAHPRAPGRARRRHTRTRRHVRQHRDRLR